MKKAEKKIITTKKLGIQDLPKKSSLLNFRFLREARRSLFKKDLQESSDIVKDFNKFDVDVLSFPYINFRKFLKFINVFSSKASKKEKCIFIFKIFDFDNDGFISKNDLNEILKMIYEGSGFNYKDFEFIIEHLLKECDQKHRGSIDFEGNKYVI